MRSKDGDLLVLPRRLLEPIWQECAVTGFVGRCWGRKHKSTIQGSTIVLSDGKVVVVVYQENASGPVRIAGFGNSSISDLESRVRTVLKESDLID